MKRAVDGDTALRGMLRPGQRFGSVVGMSRHGEQITAWVHGVGGWTVKRPHLNMFFLCDNRV